MTTTSVLLVDDDHDDFLLTRDILGRITTASYRVTWAESVERAIEALRERAYDVVLVDYRIGIRSGLEFIRDVGGLYPDCPMILLTGLGSSDVDIAAQKAGAADYLVKGNLTEDLLDRSIRYACQQAKRMTLLNAILTNSTAGMVAVDGTGRPSIWNSAGLAALDLEGSREPSSAIGAAIARWTCEGKLCSECENSRGHVFEIRASDLPGGGRLIAFHDVTQRKQVEELLRRAATDAQAASDAKSSFLANVSHELRTPLAGILGMVRVLENSGVSEVQRDYLDTVKNCGLNLLGLINDILDLSKIESGHMTVEQITYDPANVVDELVTLLAPGAFEKGVELAAFVDLAIPRSLIGDPHRVRQVLTNLVGNAIKFTSAGSVTVNAVVEADALPPMLRSDIVDCGIGIPKDRARDLFQRFSQVDASTTRRFGGTGLGLVLSRDLVELMGGRIWFESEPGVGSTFSFSVPIVGIDGPLLEFRPEQYAALRTNILCISPIEGVGDILTRYVESLGGSMTLAHDLASAGLDSRVDPFDLVVIDAVLPAADIHEIRKSITMMCRAATPVVLYLEKYGPGRREGESSIQRPLVRATIDRLCRQLLQGQPSDPRVAPANVAAPSGALRILVAEDNPVNQKLLTMLLQGFGHVSEIASDGQQVIEACAAGEFDVILMDLNMPVMDGVEATKRLRADDETRTIPIIGLTATHQKTELQRCLSAGMDELLTKPIDWDHLAAVLNRVKSSLGTRQQLAS